MKRAIIEQGFTRGGLALLVSGFALLSGCRKADDAAVEALPAAALPAAAAEAAPLDVVKFGDDGTRAEDESVVDLFAPAAPEGADEQLRKLSENERELVRTLMAHERRRNEIEQEAIRDNEEVRASHERMNDARRAYLETLQSLPEIRRLDQQLGLLRKRLSETSNLRQKMSGRAEP